MLEPWLTVALRSAVGRMDPVIGCMMERCGINRPSFIQTGKANALGCHFSRCGIGLYRVQQLIVIRGEPWAQPRLPWAPLPTIDVCHFKIFPRWLLTLMPNKLPL